MHSERALSASALLMPLVLALHSAILLCGLAGAAGLADRQVFMNALRSSPFISPALVLQSFILSCCEFVAAGAAAGVALSAPYALAQANRLANASTSNGFIDFSLVDRLQSGQALAASLRHRRAARQRLPAAGGLARARVSQKSPPCGAARVVSESSVPPGVRAVKMMFLH